MLKLLFIFFSKYCLRIFPNYKYWSVASEFFITLNLVINFISLLFLFNIKLNKVFLGVIILFIHFGIPFFLKNYDHKEFVKKYVFNFYEKAILISYFFLSIALFYIALN